jgi:hypothetical protein
VVGDWWGSIFCAVFVLRDYLDAVHLLLLRTSFAIKRDRNAEFVKQIGGKETAKIRRDDILPISSFKFQFLSKHLHVRKKILSHYVKKAWISRRTPFVCTQFRYHHCRSDV